MHELVRHTHQYTKIEFDIPILIRILGSTYASVHDDWIRYTIRAASVHCTGRFVELSLPTSFLLILVFVFYWISLRLFFIEIKLCSVYICSSTYTRQLMKCMYLHTRLENLFSRSAYHCACFQCSTMDFIQSGRGQISDIPDIIHQTTKYA